MRCVYPYSKILKTMTKYSLKPYLKKKTKKKNNKLARKRLLKQSYERF